MRPDPTAGSGQAPGLIIAAPASGAGKTTITLGLLRAYRDRGVMTGSAKTGPDYIDPGFLSAACGASARTLDSWAMRPGTLDRLACEAVGGVELVIVEGVMGLFDGAPGPGASGDGSTASLAKRYGWPVILVIDATSQSQSVAALARGFRDHDVRVPFAGVILNRVASSRHERLLRTALESAAITVLGAVPRQAGLHLPSRHLGLVQAREHHALEDFIAAAAGVIAAGCDLDHIRHLARSRPVTARPTPVLPPPGQRIAIARDAAFGFVYRHVLDGWRSMGAEILPFSPLADEAPPSADAIVLPGGYPELHAGRIAANRTFLSGLRRAAAAGHCLYGECGGYMVLGDRLTDREGRHHAMAGLLGVASSFARAGLTLGYRRAQSLVATPFAGAGAAFRGHEFHHAVIEHEGGDAALFEITDSDGTVIGPAGLCRGSVFGSFIHLVDVA